MLIRYNRRTATSFMKNITIVFIIIDIIINNVIVIINVIIIIIIIIIIIVSFLILLQGRNLLFCFMKKFLLQMIGS